MGKGKGWRSPTQKALLGMCLWLNYLLVKISFKFYLKAVRMAVFLISFLVNFFFLFTVYLWKVWLYRLDKATFFLSLVNFVLFTELCHYTHSEIHSCAESPTLALYQLEPGIRQNSEDHVVWIPFKKGGGKNKRKHDTNLGRVVDRYAGEQG